MILNTEGEHITIPKAIFDLPPEEKKKALAQLEKEMEDYHSSRQPK